MHRDFTSALFNRLVEVFPPDRAYTPEDIDEAPMPQPVRHFLEHAVRHRAEVESRQVLKLRSEWFAMDHPDVREAQRALASALAAHPRAPADDWPALLRHAVQLVVGYLASPVQTLVEFTFESHEEPLPVQTVYQRMAYFAPYGYLREVVRAYAGQRDVQEFERERFQKLLEHSDRQFTRDYKAGDWLRLLAPLYELSRRTPVYREIGAPVDLLIGFFGEKGLEGAVRRLQNAREEQRLVAVSESQLPELLAAPEPITGVQPAPEAEKPAAKPQPAGEAATAVKQSGVVKQSGAEEAKPIPLWQQFQRPASGARVEPIRSDAPTRRAVVATAPGAPPRGIPLWMRFRSTEEPNPTDTSLDVLERAVLGNLPAGQRDRYVTQLFSGSREEYERVLRSIGEAGSWVQASQIIGQEVFRKHQVDIYSEPAIRFTETIEARFKG